MDKAQLASVVTPTAMSLSLELDRELERLLWRVVLMQAERSSRDK